MPGPPGRLPSNRTDLTQPPVLADNNRGLGENRWKVGIAKQDDKVC